MAGSGRQTRGRQRIPMRLIQSQDDLYATFSKRRLGLYKKASELSTLCGIDVGIIIFSPTDNPYSFFHPSMESVMERYRNPDQPPSDLARIVEGHTRTRIVQLNKRLDEVQDTKELIKEQEKYLDEVDKTRPKGWWEQIPVESLDAQQVQEWKAWFGDLHARVTSRIEELRNGGSVRWRMLQFSVIHLVLVQQLFLVCMLKIVFPLQVHHMHQEVGLLDLINSLASIIMLIHRAIIHLLSGLVSSSLLHKVNILLVSIQANIIAYQELWIHLASTMDLH
ncbi:UNVERIFIED_CONTAM: Agamous-like MADS-box protein [Sesamum latifolium]|uniref:Agamous-like MADS-box protein n=1 Tax=Sesamum latifolium TaxID=2727402 RepID=A0AAW2SN95_9LAMI